MARRIGADSGLARRPGHDGHSSIELRLRLSIMLDSVM